MQTFTARQYLAIDIASNYGMDKDTWNDRINWVIENEDNLEDLITTAKEPALYFAGVRAYRDVQAGKPIGYPISLDATSSGLQLLACLTGDRSAAQLCNVLNFKENDVTQRRDGYTVIYKAMVDAIGENSKISRDDVKTAIMTALYGSKAEPKRVFGEGVLLLTFYKIMAEYAPSAWELNQTMPFFWQDTKCHSWTLPDNYHVHVKVMSPTTTTVNFLNAPYDIVEMVNEPLAEGRSLGANTIHSLDGMIVREMLRRCMHNPDQLDYVRSLINGTETMSVGETMLNMQMTATLWKHYKESGYLSARILDYLDSATIHLVDTAVITEMIDTFPEKPFELMAVHDCFRCLPNYGNDLRKQYNLQLKLIAKSEILSCMLSHISGKHIPVTKNDPDIWKEIEDTNYALS